MTLEPVHERIANPHTGQVIDLAGATTDVLVEAVEALRQRETEYAQWRRAAEDEVMKRMDAADRKVYIGRLGEREVELTIDWRRGRVWDADELDSVLTDLVDRGELSVRQAAGVLRRSLTVDARAALRLVEGLREGSATRRAIEDCFAWRSKGRRALKIAEVPDLGQGLPERVELET